MKKLILTPFAITFSFFALSSIAQIQGPTLESELDIEFPGLHDREALVEIEFTVNSEGRAEGFQASPDFMSSVSLMLQWKPSNQPLSTRPWRKGSRLNGPDTGLRQDM